MRALVLALVLAACGSPDAPTEAPAPKLDEPRRITLSERVAREAGVTSGAIDLASLPATVELTGEVAADPDRVAKVAVRVAGRIVEVRVHEGQSVAAGQVIAAIESSEVARIRSELSATRTRATAARARAERLGKLLEAGTASAQDHETARAEASVLDAEVAAARQALASIGGGGGDTARLELRAPFAGVIAKRDGVIGQPVAADHVVAEIVDLSHAVFVARLFEHDLARTHEGSTAEVRLDAYPDAVFPGVVQTIGRQVDPSARAVFARIAIADRDAQLKIGLFGTALVVVPEPGGARSVPVVPASAVTMIDDKPVVFVEVQPRTYEARAVELGHAVNGRVEIAKGLTGAERVAVAGLFTLKSIALKSSFGEED